MPGDYLPDDLKDLWQDLGTNPSPISIDGLRTEMGKLRKGLRRRFVIGAGAVLIVVSAFAASFFLFPNFLQRIGSVMTIAGTAYLVWQLVSGRSRMPDQCDAECFRFYRAELERQRDFHRGWWFWSRLVFFLPGPVVFLIGFAQAYPKQAKFIWLECAALGILAIIAVPLNLRLARRYQRRIDSLNRSQGETG